MKRNISDLLDRYPAEDVELGGNTPYSPTRIKEITMKKNNNLDNQPLSGPEDNDEEMTVTLDLLDGTSVTCALVTILTVRQQDYIVLLPLEEDGENHDGMVWFYRYHEDKENPNEEPELEYIEDDEEYEIVSDAFDEYLDNAEFDELTDGLTQEE